MVLFNPMVELSLIAVAMVIIQQAIQEKIGNKKQLKEHQEKMKNIQEKVKGLIKKDDEKSRNERESLEKEMIESMNIVMQGSMKFMVVSLVIVLPLFWIAGLVYGAETINLPLPVPWFAASLELFNPLTWIELYSQTNWIGWYVLNSIIFSILIVNPLMKIIESKKKR